MHEKKTESDLSELLFKTMTIINKETMKPSEIGLKADPLKKSKISGTVFNPVFLLYSNRKFNH